MNSYSSSQMRRVTVTPRPLCTSFIPQIPRRKWCADLCQTYSCTRFFIGLITHSLGIIANWLLLEQGTGVGPVSTPWKGVVRPFNYPCIYAAYSAATALSRARNCLASFATIRAFPPFFVSLSSLSEIRTFFISISLCVITENLPF